MHIFTHLGFAQVIMGMVEKEMGVKLDAKGFAYGNIKPDLSPALIKIPHFNREESMNFIQNEIQSLMNYNFNENKRNIPRNFSERLGVITHYLSDFFCYAHSKHFTGNTLDHYMYEFKLSIYCKINKKTIRNFDCSKYLSKSSNFNSICELIKELQNKYISKKPSFALDTIFTLRMCTNLCILVISDCMSKSIKKAA